MHKCDLCNKEFKFKSDLFKHKNRKTPCIKQPISDCELCKVKFKCNADKIRHEKSIKHNNNITNITGHNVHTGSGNINNITNITNIICPINIFRNTNIACLEEDNISYLLGYNKNIIDSYNQIEETKKINNTYYSMYFMKAILNIFKELNFNINHKQNNNIKRLVFVNNQSGESYKNISMYLILEIDSNNKFIWKEIDYYTFIYELLSLMNSINRKYENKKLDMAVNFLETYFNNNDRLKNLCKESLEVELAKLSNTLLLEGDKNVNANNKVEEFIHDNTKLYNGTLPPITNIG